MRASNLLLDLAVAINSRSIATSPLVAEPFATAAKIDLPFSSCPMTVTKPRAASTLRQKDRWNDSILKSAVHVPVVVHKGVIPEATTPHPLRNTGHEVSWISGEGGEVIHIRSQARGGEHQNSRPKAFAVLFSRHSRIQTNHVILMICSRSAFIGFLQASLIFVH